ncbi:hypothetical protein Vafri_3581 [Volvox africanus]|uniref:U-box domain-containing protein n=1 Tax=Volvox africanus TaxID=51714 RepID=A0A8J4AVR1_9CHLO|nr:hypothetical protein Vafri_3581 [Volvox africanus]
MLFLGLRKNVDQKVPTTFVCPLSFAIMSDPVADPDDPEGRAAERIAVEEFQRRYGFRPFSGLPPTVNHLPLAKLQSTIADFLNEDGILQQIEHRPHKRLRGGEFANGLGPRPGVANHLSDQSSTQQVALDFLAQEIPVTFFCPLSWRVMHDPVIDIRNVGDVSWDRSAIEDHLAEHNTNPKTGGLLTTADLRPDRNLKGAIAWWLRKHTRPYPRPTRVTGETPRGEAAASWGPAVGVGRLPRPAETIPEVPDPVGVKEPGESATIGGTKPPDATLGGVAMASAAVAAGQGIPSGLAAVSRIEQQRLIVLGGKNPQLLEEPVHVGRCCIAAAGVTMADAVVARAACRPHPPTASAAIDGCDTTMDLRVISGATIFGSNAVVLDTAKAAEVVQDGEASTGRRLKPPTGDGAHDDQHGAVGPGETNDSGGDHQAARPLLFGEQQRQPAPASTRRPHRLAARIAYELESLVIPRSQHKRVLVPGNEVNRLFARRGEAPEYSLCALQGCSSPDRSAKESDGAARSGDRDVTDAINSARDARVAASDGWTGLGNSAARQTSDDGEGSNAGTVSTISASADEAACCTVGHAGGPPRSITTIVDSEATASDGGAAAKNQQLVEAVQTKTVRVEDLTVNAGSDVSTGPGTVLLDAGLHRHGPVSAVPQAYCDALHGPTQMPVQEQQVKGISLPLPQAVEQQHAKKQLQQRKAQLRLQAMLMRSPPGVHLELLRDNQPAERQQEERQQERQQEERQVAERQQEERQVAERQPAERQSAERQPEERQPAERQPEERQPKERQPAERQPAERQPAERQPAERQLAERQPAERQPAERQPEERQQEERQLAERQPEERQPAERQQEERQQEERQPAERQPAERQPEERQQEERQQEERQLAEMQPAERQPAERQPEERQPEERQPAERQPEERQVAERQPAERQPAERQPAERQPAERQPEERQQEERQLAERQPAERQPAERQPAERQQEERQLAERQPAERQPAERQPAERQPAERQPAERQPAERQPAERQPAERQPAERQPEERQQEERQSAERQQEERQSAERQQEERQSAQLQQVKLQPSELQPAELYQAELQPLCQRPAGLQPAYLNPAGMQPTEQKQKSHHPTESTDPKPRRGQHVPASERPRRGRVTQGWRPVLAPAELADLLSVASTLPSNGLAPAAVVGVDDELPPNKPLWAPAGPTLPTTSSHNTATIAPLEALSGPPSSLRSLLTSQTGLKPRGADGTAAGVGLTRGTATKLGQRHCKAATDEPPSGSTNTSLGKTPFGGDLGAETWAPSAGGKSSPPAGALPIATAMTPTATASAPLQSHAHRASARSNGAKVVYATTWAELLTALKEAAANSSVETKRAHGATPGRKRTIEVNMANQSLVCEAHGAATADVDTSTAAATLATTAAASAGIEAAAVVALEPSRVIDLRGAVLVAPRTVSIGACPSNSLCRQPRSRLSPLRITAEGVMLRNGTLQLQRGQGVQVRARAVQLVELTICGPGIGAAPKEEVGLLEILGSNTTVSLKDCRVSMQQLRGGVTAASTSAGTDVGGIASGDPEPCCAAVLVGRGASAHLQNCTITGAGRDGLLAWGLGSQVSANLCTVRDCGASGFAAIEGGCMGPLFKCQAHSNKLYGFCAEDPCSLLRVGTGCTSQGNEVGFGSTHGGATIVTAGCIAEGNTDVGFKVVKAKSRLTAQDGCIARGCGIGFAAGEGGKLFAGRGCVAEGMTGHTGGAENDEDDPFDGFLATGPRSQLIAGPGCRAEGNRRGAGFAARYGGVMELGPDCVSRQNGRFGFAAEGPRAQLEVGERCVAEQNSKAGFVAAFGGSLRAAGGCVAVNNDNAGFMASRDNSRLTAGPGCIAERSTGDGASGFVAQCGGSIEAGCKCVSRDNAADGFVAHGRGSSLFAGPDCKSSWNGSTGYLAAKDGKLTMASGCIGIGNRGEGFCALGGFMTVGAGCRAEDNNLDGFAACRSTDSQNSSGGASGTRGRGSGGIARGDGQVGVLDASAGDCCAQGNGGSGFCCEDSGCRLVAGRCCVATSNRGSGFSVKDGGELSAGKGCTATSNMGWGFIAVGKRTLLQLWPGCHEAAAAGGNASGASRAQGGAVIATHPV